MARCSLVSWAIALSASSALAHPLFNGRLISRTDELLKEYDYVIVGGGASGLTVANRLSEQPSKSATTIRVPQLLVTLCSYYCPGHRSRSLVSYN